MYILHKPLEMHTIKDPSTKRSRDKALKLSFIFSEKLRRFVVERVIGIGFVKQVDESVNDRIDIKHRLPILSENV